MKIITAIKYLYPDIDFTKDIIVSSDKDSNQTVLFWDTDKLGQQPSDQQLMDVIDNATFNDVVNTKIQALEIQQTPQKVREAILGIDNGWLLNINDEIVALRNTLK